MLPYLFDFTLQAWLALLLLFLVSYNFVVKQSWRGLPPGPPCLPLVGSLPFLGATDIRAPLMAMAQKYGDMFTIYMGSRRVIILNGFDTVKEVFARSGHKFAGRPDIFFITEATNGYGIVSSTGEFWKEQRRHALHVLRDFGFGRSLLEDDILEEVNFFIQEMKLNTDVPIFPLLLLQQSVANVISAVALGKRFDYKDPKFQRYLQLSSEGVQIVGSSGALSVFPFLRFLPGDLFRFKQLMKNRDFMDGEYRTMIEEHMQTFDPEREPRDFIDAYIKMMKSEEQNGTDTTFTELQLIRIIGDLFTAGTDTTSTTLTWSILYMTLNPLIQAKVQAEIDDVMRRDEVPRMSHRGKLPYTEACMCETQRISDIVPLGVPHAATEDVTFRGHFIPKGTMLMPNMNSVHLDPRVWPEPHKFDPTRFLDDEGQPKKREEFMPFSIGKRLCLGEGLARMELFLYFVSMMQHYRFSPAPGYPVPGTDGVLGMTYLPKEYHVVIQHRT